ncbi:MAG TPA: L-seryl-tRNA(Sec) selenium transferase [Terriglobales bacterium]|nr:L-seryl-tRNA(Sec) selenium transferase [Terriglobales bacterium]
MSTANKSALFQKLPSTDELLRQPNMQALVEREGHSAVAESIRVVLAHLRQEIAGGRIADGQIAGAQLNEKSLDLALGGLSAAVERQLRQSLSYSLRPLVNATGVILHTNLGRAPLAPSALDHVRATASAYSNLEFDLSTGERGKRDVHVDRLFRKLLRDDRVGTTALGRPAEHSPAKISTAISTIVVNNNAAAVLLALNSLAEGGEVLVSRGELVEIGGSFRIPDVMSKSGATLREVGTTNRTRAADYELAINDRTRLLLRVHRSNFEITGFTEQPGLDELVALARRRNLPLMQDLGSGALFDLRSVGINGEPGVLDSLRAGIDIVTYSGDKLLGGPQAGLISGRADLVARMRSNSLFRALRVDKLTYAALEATLLAYVKCDHDAVPVLRMMRLSKDEIARRAGKIVSQVESAQVKSAHLKLEMRDGESVIGGGAAPSAVLPTRLIALTRADLSADEINARLRASTPPIIARVEEGRVLLDLRTVFPDQDANLATVLASLT